MGSLGGRSAAPDGLPDGPADPLCLCDALLDARSGSRGLVAVVGQVLELMRQLAQATARRCIMRHRHPRILWTSF